MRKTLAAGTNAPLDQTKFRDEVNLPASVTTEPSVAALEAVMYFCEARV